MWNSNEIASKCPHGKIHKKSWMTVFSYFFQKGRKKQKIRKISMESEGNWFLNDPGIFQS